MGSSTLAASTPVPWQRALHVVLKMVLVAILIEFVLSR